MIPKEHFSLDCIDTVASYMQVQSQILHTNLSMDFFWHNVFTEPIAFIFQMIFLHHHYNFD